MLSDNIIILADYKQRSGDIFGPINIPCRTRVIAGIRAGHRVQVQREVIVNQPLRLQ